MARPKGCWWECGPFQVEGLPKILVAKEDFSRQEADALAAQAVAQVMFPDLYRDKAGYVKLDSGSQPFWGLLHISEDHGTLELPHEYPGGKRDPKGLRTPDPKKITSFSILGYFDGSGYLVEYQKA